MTHPKSKAPDDTDAAAGVRTASGQRVPWHTLSVAATMCHQNSSAIGLQEAEAARRLDAFGPNELVAFQRVSGWRSLLAQFENRLILILLVAAALAAMMGHSLEAVVIAVIVLFAVALGCIQEFRAERALAALQKMAAPMAHVLRDGRERTLISRELVPGDVLLLRAGDRVPADARITLAVNLTIDEAALTGESVPVAKTALELDDPGLAVADRIDMVHAGTLVTSGRGRAVVVATGMSTEFGIISKMVQAVRPGRTPLQQNLDRVGRTLGKAALVVIVVIVGAGLWRGLGFVDMLLFGIALAVAVVPEALPAVVTISLAVGVRRMVKRNALVRCLPVVETLGCTSVICSDKTGTLTRNEMTVRSVLVEGRLLTVSGSGYEPSGRFQDGANAVEPSAALRELLRAGVLASDARLDCVASRWRIEGDPTEGALVVAAAKAGLDKLELDTRWPRVHELPFTAERRRMTTLHRAGSEVMAFSKGAADVIFADCTHELRDGRDVALTDARHRQLQAAEQRMAGEGLRVLALARRLTAPQDDPERGMTLLGLVGIMDPPRPEARAAVARCEDAGITPVMITGDHPLTARAVGEEIGLAQGRVVAGRELEAMSDAELDREVAGIRVYARVSPADKLRVVAAWQRRGDVVAMTGDGVNDAPALKQADVGIAMGITGTDVSREAAGVTLLDDNFASIVAAVEEGRIVFENIRKYLMYLLSSNTGEILLMAGAALAGLPMPLTAVQILYVNLATDGLPALALAVDPPAPELMRRAPRDPRAGIFTPPIVALLLTGGIWSALVNLCLFTYLLHSGRPVEEAMTLTFLSLVLIQFCKAYNYRSDRASVFDRPFANRWLNLAIVWELCLLAVIVYVPALQPAFGTFRVTAADWAMVVSVSLTVIPVLEAVKWIERRGWLGRLA